MKRNTCGECRFWMESWAACFWAPPVENRGGFSLERETETPACREFKPVGEEEKPK